MANVQTFWNHTGAKIDPVDVRSSAFLTANAWDNIANNLGGIGKTLIEDPMSKRYLHDLNQGKDVSGYNPMVLSQEVLEKTPTIMGQLVSNNQDKLNYNVALAKENDIRANSDLYNKAMALSSAGDIDAAQQLLREYANRSMRADVSKEFMPDIFKQLLDKQQADAQTLRANASMLGAQSQAELAKLKVNEANQDKQLNIAYANIDDLAQSNIRSVAEQELITYISTLPEYLRPKAWQYAINTHSINRLYNKDGTKPSSSNTTNNNWFNKGQKNEPK